jgi:hypothetical protein
MFFVLPAIIIYRLSLRILKDAWLAFATTFSYLFQQLVFIGSTIGSTYNFISLPFLILELYFIACKKTAPAIIFFILACATKADLLLIHACLGGMLYFSKEEKLRSLSKVILAISLTWLALELIFVIPKINLSHLCVTYADSFSGAISYFINRPQETLFFVLYQIPQMFIIYFVHTAFLPLLSPLYLCPVLGIIPILLFRSDSTNLFSVLAFIYLALIYGAQRLILEKKVVSKAFLGVCIIGAALISHYFFHIIYIDPRIGIIPFSKGFSLDKQFYSPRAKSGWEILKKIPNRTSCFTISSLADRLGEVKKIGIYGLTPLTDFSWEYMLFSIEDINYNLGTHNRQEYANMIQRVLESKIYRVDTYKDGWLLLHKTDAGENPDNQLTEKILTEMKQNLGLNLP